VKFIEIVWTDSVTEWRKNCCHLNDNQEKFVFKLIN